MRLIYTIVKKNYNKYQIIKYKKWVAESLLILKPGKLLKNKEKLIDN